MEEQLHQYEKSRRIFERWMQWHPDEKAWMAYINLEMRLAGKRIHKISRARKIWERFCSSHGDLNSFVKFAKWEQKHGFLAEARKIYEQAMQLLDDEEYHEDASFFLGTIFLV